MRGTPTLVAGLALVGVAGLGACSAGSDDPTTPLPDGVELALEQTRSDVAGRRVQVQVVNDGDAPVEVERATVTSTRFGGVAHYTGPATIAPGATTNLTVELPPARCGDGGVGATVEIAYRLDDRARTSRVRPEDRYGSVARLMGRDCAAQALDVRATSLDVDGKGRGSTLRLGVELRATRTVEVGAIGSTVLLDVRGGGVDRRLAAGERTVQELTVRPARCDVHAVAEDKVGTLLPVEVGIGASADAPLTRYVALSDEQRAAVFDFVSRHCGFGEVDDPLADD